MAPGKVYLVGAGPGHPELLTLKAAALIQSGDVIVYDRLVQEEVVAYSKPSAERIYMGKTPGRHESRQEEIHELLARKSLEGKVVVRLKGGDPFLFGRGGEEAEYLAAHGIPFEVVPGVSSALAAPESAGIAITHRDIASSVAIVTGHESKRETSRIDWGALSRIDTVVFLMAVNGTGRIAKELMARGRSPETPAAMIQMAYWQGERVICGTLASIGGDVERAGIEPPATLVIGEAVRLRERLAVSQRDLYRGGDAGLRSLPGPGPDQLLRLAIGGLGTQTLRLALLAGVFDHLEEWQTASSVAKSLNLNTRAVGELLDCLRAQGLIEAGAEGYRNLELASRYLVDGSPQSLKATLLYYASLGSTSGALCRYVLDGRQPGSPMLNHGIYEASCENLAQFNVPFVIDQLDLSRRSPALIAGWGWRRYQEAVTARWPHLTVDARNPFAGERNGHGAPVLPSGPFRAILLSGVLASCNRGEVQRVLQAAAAALDSDGMLALQDAFLPDSELPAEVTALETLGRHVTRGGCAAWSLERLRDTLIPLGLGVIESHSLPAASELVIARRGEGVKAPAPKPIKSGC
jgi:uroporphyrin-III C-methyltransferase